ncbi:MAG: pseudouridine synthase, partial [Pseudomonadales bacterium]|nr:pseudouridine synthase [Pseudomonadales bacterium]
MAVLLLLNKPFYVLSQFRATPGQRTLADFLDVPGFYPAGRLDK